MLYFSNCHLIISTFFLTCFFHSPIAAQDFSHFNEPSIEAHEIARPIDDSIQIIETYFKNFEALARTEQWNELLSQGEVALKAARRLEMPQSEAKICAQLTSTAFYLGDYDCALEYVTRCHQLSNKFEDPSLFVRTLYLESAVHRAFAGKNGQDESYMRAVQMAEEALLAYEKNGLNDNSLLGKVYFNLGAAHADNPEGDLTKAETAYTQALQCYTASHTVDDLTRTRIRLGKLYLLQKEYALIEKIISESRPQISTERLAMHLDYLEARLKVEMKDHEGAIKIAKTGLTRAQSLRAKEDESRFISLLQSITAEFTF